LWFNAQFYSAIREVGVGFILQNVLLHDIMHELVLVLQWQEVNMFCFQQRRITFTRTKYFVTMFLLNTITINSCLKYYIFVEGNISFTLFLEANNQATVLCEKCQTRLGMICSRQFLSSSITWLMATSCSTFNLSSTTDTTHSNPLFSAPSLFTRKQLLDCFAWRMDILFHQVFAVWLCSLSGHAFDQISS